MPASHGIHSNINFEPTCTVIVNSKSPSLTLLAFRTVATFTVSLELSVLIVYNYNYRTSTAEECLLPKVDSTVSSKFRSRG